MKIQTANRSTGNTVGKHLGELVYFVQNSKILNICQFVLEYSSILLLIQLRKFKLSVFYENVGLIKM